MLPVMMVPARRYLADKKAVNSKTGASGGQIPCR